MKGLCLTDGFDAARRERDGNESMLDLGVERKMRCSGVAPFAQNMQWMKGPCGLVGLGCSHGGAVGAAFGNGSLDLGWQDDRFFVSLSFSLESDSRGICGEQRTILQGQSSFFLFFFFFFS